MSDKAPLRVLIVDDEPLGRQRIADLLREDRGVEIVGMIGDGVSAVEAIRTAEPDLVFLDVQMPGMSGLDVVRTIGPTEMPATVFVTAYDKHALTAFDLAAIDYLVKPFDDDRFEQAFQRARRMAWLEAADQLRKKLLAVLGEVGSGKREAATEMPEVKTASAVPPAGSRFIERIPVESRGKVRFIPVAEIDCILASGPYAELVVGDRKHLIREAMQNLEDQLDPARFFRVHRSGIVQLDRVDALLKSASGECEVQLKNGLKIKVARARREELESRLGT
ncbi:MAG TPA: LytTR family DNA-binding domain-containing protein [Gemmatimonadaceae bacterium]|nr:LytTR family DNA-binding domain-containing protein [Gemmatimonadaceae bacterium]